MNRESMNNTKNNIPDYIDMYNTNSEWRIPPINFHDKIVLRICK